MIDFEVIHPSQETKVCRACGEPKELREFYVDRFAADGRKSQCRVCYRGYYNSQYTPIGVKATKKQESRGAERAAKREDVDLGLAALGDAHVPGYTLTHEAIADVCNCTKENIRFLERRALRRFRRLFEQAGGKEIRL